MAGRGSLLDVVPPREGGRGERRAVRMVPSTMRVEGRTVRFAVSSNDGAYGPGGPGTPPIWAVNIHGYFAGGGMYWRESALLAERLGWRVVNPCLPGFAGSDPLGSSDVSVRDFATAAVEVLDHLAAGPAVVLGHSMGGAVAMALADSHPHRVLGIVYRDGVATPSWRERHGLLVSMARRVVADRAALVDLAAAFALDLPDLLIGRHPGSTMRMTVPDARRNLRVATSLVPIAAMLMRLDLRDVVARVAETGIPVLPEWGCFDRIVTPATAAELSQLVHQPVVWVPGGHSWMLPRPRGQSDILTHLPQGQRFVEDVEQRWRAHQGRFRHDGPVTTLVDQHAG